MIKSHTPAPLLPCSLGLLRNLVSLTDLYCTECLAWVDRTAFMPPSEENKIESKGDTCSNAYSWQVSR